MVWSHNESWMVTGDHAGYVKYWQSNMNNVKMFQAHKEAIRGLRYIIHHTSPYVSCATVADNPFILAVVRTLDATLILFLFWFYAVSGRAIMILVWVHRWFLTSHVKHWIIHKMKHQESWNEPCSRKVLIVVSIRFGKELLIYLSFAEFEAGFRNDVVKTRTVELIFLKWFIVEIV